ncbi:MAG: alkaline phosphatase family protein [Bryobacteraceae bacterium]
MRWFACLLLCAAAAAQNARRAVVVVSLDGLPAGMLEDPRLPMPTLRRLMREGAAVKRVRVSNPSVTWPSHTTLITGVWPAGHGVLYNGMLIEGRVQPWRPQPEMVRARTVYDAAHAAGLTTAQVDWVAIYQAPGITWAFPEVPDPKGPIEREMTAAGLVSEADLADFPKGNILWRDRIWTAAAAHILRRHRPDLLLYHLLSMDSTHHRHGPGTVAGLAVAAFCDDRLREVLDAVRETGRPTSVLVISDHGFKAVRRNIRASVAVGSKAQVIPEGGAAMVYLRDPAQREEVKGALAAIEGVARVYEESEFGPLGMPTRAQNSQAPHLIAAARPGYAFAGGTEGPPVVEVPTGGSHGYLSSDPEMDAMLVAWGDGVRPGAEMASAEAIDVAPTIGGLLGVRFEAAGRVLKPLLR